MGIFSLLSGEKFLFVNKVDHISLFLSLLFPGTQSRSGEWYAPLPFI